MRIGHRRRYGGRLIPLDRPPTKGEKQLECRVILCVYTCGIFEFFRKCWCRNWGKSPPPDVDPNTGIPIDPEAQVPIMPEDNFSTSKPDCGTGLKCGAGVNIRNYGGHPVDINRPRTKGEKAMDCRIILCSFTYGISELFRLCFCRNWGKYPPPDVDPNTGIPKDPQTGVPTDPKAVIGMEQVAKQPVTMAPGGWKYNERACHPSNAANPKSVVEVDGGKGNYPRNSSSNYTSSKDNDGNSTSSYPSSYKGTYDHSKM